MVLGLASKLDQLRQKERQFDVTLRNFRSRLPNLKLFLPVDRADLMTDPNTPDSEPDSKIDDLRRRYRVEKHSGSDDHTHTKQEQQTLMRLASAGFELASFSLILGGLGYAVDYSIGLVTPYFAIAGLLLGFSLGFYRLIMLASRLS